MRWLALFATAAVVIGQAPDPLQKVYASAVAEYNAGRIAQARTQLEKLLNRTSRLLPRIPRVLGCRRTH